VDKFSDVSRRRNTVLYIWGGVSSRWRKILGLEIQFLGGASTVTGSKTLISVDGKKVLIDCGLFQGLKFLREKNWNPLPIPASELSAVVLTHAHIDHSGYIPRLIKDGFRGRIYCTSATRDVCAILLPDAGYLQEEEAEYLNKGKKSKHHPALPLFTQREAEESLKYFHPVELHEEVKLAPNISFYFQIAGHMLGAAAIILKAAGKTLAFTGDVGRLEDPIYFAPEVLPPVDYLITESTYGNRLHPKVDPLYELERIVTETERREGVILIPAFAIGRAQALMHALWTLRRQERIPDIPMYLNSPMATDFAAVFRKHPDFHRLTVERVSAINSIFKFVRSSEESKELNERQGPMIIISAAGMLTGGRILHHLKAFAPQPQNTIVLSGYQAAGTRGETLQNGAREVKIHGAYVPVLAQVETIGNLSGHADHEELTQWLGASKMKPKQVFVNHGEPSAADEFRRRLTEHFSWDCVVPQPDQKFQLS